MSRNKLGALPASPALLPPAGLLPVAGLETLLGVGLETMGLLLDTGVGPPWRPRLCLDLSADTAEGVDRGFLAGWGKASGCG